MLTSIAGMVAYLARDAGLAWRGISPVFGILVGALPLLAVDGWQYFAHPRPSQTQAAPSPEARRNLMRGNRPTSAWTQAPGIQPDVRFAGTLPDGTAPLPAAGAPADGTLERVASVLNGPGRAAARAVLMTAAAGARGADVTSQIALAQRGLADLQASLQRVRSENPSLSEQLDSALEDAPFAEVDAGLREFSDAESAAGGRYADPAALRQAMAGLRTTGVRLERWITACNQRIADLKESIDGANGG